MTTKEWLLEYLQMQISRCGADKESESQRLEAAIALVEQGPEEPKP